MATKNESPRIIALARSREARLDKGREPLLVSKRDAAVALSLSVRTIENLIAAKKLPARKIGRRTLIPYSALRGLASRDTDIPIRGPQMT